MATGEIQLGQIIELQNLTFQGVRGLYIYILLVITEIKLSKVGSVEDLRELANLKKINLIFF